ncbi:MAG: peptide chain release factor N(5)-glutamine methyltransferase, partial [Bacillota bacterium]|nr:peptide chain release factor N(5)-glutamine methyltransferase [Bacillota bacterium]
MALMIKDLLQMGESRLAAAGCDNPRGDAEALFRYMNQVDRNYIFTHYSTEIMDDRCDYYFEFIDERCTRKPLQYMLGTQEFMGLSFRVNEDVMVPRQETEIITEKAMELLKGRRAGLGGLQVLDLCCGSGAIAVSLARLLPQIKMKLTAADVSPQALAVARDNAARNGVSPRISFVEGDLFAPLPLDRKGRGKTRFDLIVSNPPYIPAGVIDGLEPEVSRYEPRLALDGGADGLDFYRRIAKEAPIHMKEDGLLLLEIGHDQGAALVSLLEEEGAFRDVCVFRDLAG